MIGIFSKMKKKKPVNEKIKLKDHHFFSKIKPKESYKFFSDYFMIDNTYASIITVFYRYGAGRSLDYFWGVRLIPDGLKGNVVIQKMMHIAPVSEEWVAKKQEVTEKVFVRNESEVSSKSFTSKNKFNREAGDLEIIARDLSNGDSYLRVAIKILVKADTLDALDEAIEQINRQYKNNMKGSFSAYPYFGVQRRELTNLFGKVDLKEGKNFMLTSTELSGAYPLVTHGIEDHGGEYVGVLSGDVNNSAVLFDINRYHNHVVIAGSNKGKTVSYTEKDLNYQTGVDVWGAKLGVNCLLNNNRVVHLVLNDAKVNKIGLPFEKSTSIVDLTTGDINPFEMFGKVDEELSVFAAHLNKLCLMAFQFYESNNLRTIAEGKLREILIDFYVDHRMWFHDAKKNRSRIKIVNVPHDEVPLLRVFITYLNNRYEKAAALDNDHDIVKSLNILRMVFKNMLDTNGDLFDTITSNVIDVAVTGSRVIYDFSSLLQRGKEVMMAQYLNALSLSVGTLKEGDLVVLHGVQHLTSDIKEYTKDIFKLLKTKGVRVAYIYNDIKDMLDDKDFNNFDKADYTVLGGMSANEVDAYGKSLSENRDNLPGPLKNLLEHRSNYRYYLRRGYDNVIFDLDFFFGNYLYK